MDQISTASRSMTAKRSITSGMGATDVTAPPSDNTNDGRSTKRPRTAQSLQTSSEWYLSLGCLDSFERGYVKTSSLTILFGEKGAKKLSDSRVEFPFLSCRVRTTDSKSKALRFIVTLYKSEEDRKNARGGCAIEGNTNAILMAEPPYTLERWLMPDEQNINTWKIANSKRLRKRLSEKEIRYYTKVINENADMNAKWDSLLDRAKSKKVPGYEKLDAASGSHDSATEASPEDKDAKGEDDESVDKSTLSESGKGKDHIHADFEDVDAEGEEYVSEEEKNTLASMAPPKTLRDRDENTEAEVEEPDVGDQADDPGDDQNASAGGESRSASEADAEGETDNEGEDREAPPDGSDDEETKAVSEAIEREADFREASGYENHFFDEAATDVEGMADRSR